MEAHRISGPGNLHQEELTGNRPKVTFLRGTARDIGQERRVV